MKINLAVLFGGKSVEHEISIISAVQAIGCIPDKYEVYPVYITKNNEFYYGGALKDINEYKDIPALLKKCVKVYFITEGSKTYIFPGVTRLFSKPKPIALIDAAFPVVHGTNVEDGALQGFLKTLNLPFAGCDVLSSAVCMDKFYMKVLLKHAGFPVLDCLRFTAADCKTPDKIAEEAEAKFQYPLVVKPVNLGSSIGITRAENKNELEEALNTAFCFASQIIIEPAVANLREINCAVLGDADEATASECEEPIADAGILSYSDKYLNECAKKSGSKGMASLKRKIPADITPEVKEKIRQLSVAAFRRLDCSGVARIDFLMNGQTGEIWLNELNTIPGSLSFYLWEPMGITYTELIDRLISLALKRRRKQEDIIFSFDTNILSVGGAFKNKGAKSGT